MTITMSALIQARISVPNIAMCSKSIFLEDAQKIFCNDFLSNPIMCERTNVAEQRKVRNEAKIKRPPVVTDDCDSLSVCTLSMFSAFFYARLIFRSYFSRPFCRTFAKRAIAQ